MPSGVLLKQLARVLLTAPADGALSALAGAVSSTATISVNQTRWLPNGLFAGADRFDVSSQTIVLGNSGSNLFGSLGNVWTGDVV